MEETAFEKIRTKMQDVADSIKDIKDLQSLNYTMIEEFRLLGIHFHACGVNLVSLPKSEMIFIIRSDDVPSFLPENDPGAKKLRELWSRGEVSYRRDLRQEDPWDEAALMIPKGINCVIDVPFAYGTLALNSTETDAFSAENIALFKSVATILSYIFDKLKTLNLLDSIEEDGIIGFDLERFWPIQMSVRSEVWQMERAEDIEKVLIAVVKGLTDLGFPYSSCGINLINDLDEPTEVTAYGYLALNTSWSKITVLRKDLILDIWRKGEPLYRPDLWVEDPYGERNLYGGVRSVLDVPFSHGTLAVSSIRPGIFDEGHTQYLTLMAEVLSEGFKRLKGLEQLHRQQDELKNQERVLKSFQNIAELALDSLELKKLVEEIAYHIINANVFRSLIFVVVDHKKGRVKAYTGLRHLWDEKKENILVKPSPDVDLIDFSFEDDDIFVDVAYSGNMEVIEGWDERFFQSELKDSYGNRMSYFIPIKKDDRVVAIMATGSDYDEKERMLNQIELMKPLLVQVALAIEKAQLFEELRENIRLENEQKNLDAGEQAVRLQVAKMNQTQDIFKVLQEIEEQLNRFGVQYDRFSTQIVNSDGDDFCSLGIRNFTANKIQSNHPFFRLGINWKSISNNVEKFPNVLEIYKGGKGRYFPEGPLPLSPDPLVEVPFSYGTLAVSGAGLDGFGYPTIVLLERLARPLSEGFRRYLDLIDRNRTQDELASLNLELEERVSRRTAELKSANDKLNSEIEEGIRRENNLRESEALLLAAEEVAGIGSWRYQVEDEWVKMSGRVSTILGFGMVGSVRPRTILQSVYPEDRPEALKAMRELLEKQIDIELRILLPNGVIRWVQARGGPLKDVCGTVSGAVGMMQDITDQHALNQEARKARNLESLGVLAGGIAHDFNNVLTGVTGSLSLLEAQVESGSPQHKIIDRALKATDRATDLSARLITFAKGGVPNTEETTLEELVVETVDLALHGSKTRPEFRFDAELAPVVIDKVQISQVVQNLALNAVQAMPEGGALEIGARQKWVDDNSKFLLKPGAYIQVWFQDEGCGIPNKILERVFDPYFTTKETGNGLGLAICYSIMQKHGGHLTVETEVGRGTRFDFYLPVAENRAKTKAGKINEVIRASGRVLLMDDERMVHESLGDMLGELGYHMDAANDGVAALEKYEFALQEGEVYDFVILALTVSGGMGGVDTAKRLRELNPQVRLIVLSDYTDDPIMGNYRDYGFDATVEKPVVMHKLSGAIQRLR